MRRMRAESCIDYCLFSGSRVRYIFCQGAQVAFLQVNKRYWLAILVRVSHCYAISFFGVTLNHKITSKKNEIIKLYYKPHEKRDDPNILILKPTLQSN